MPANVENSAEAIGWEKVRFHSSPNEGQCQECSNYLINTITLFSHAIKVMFKILQVMLQQYLNFQMYISWILKNQRTQRSNCQHALDHRKSKRVPGKHLFLLYWLRQSLWLCGSQNLWKILKEMGIPDHLTCLLRNLYAGQETTVRIRHGTTD